MFCFLYGTRGFITVSRKYATGPHPEPSESNSPHRSQFQVVPWKVPTFMKGPSQPRIQWVSGTLSLGVKRPGREADHSPPSSAEVKDWVELYLSSPSTPSWRGAQLKKHRDNFTLLYFMKREDWSTCSQNPTFEPILSQINPSAHSFVFDSCKSNATKQGLTREYESRLAFQGTPRLSWNSEVSLPFRGLSFSWRWRVMSWSGLWQRVVKQLVTGRYPQPVESNLHHHTVLT
jgi:hypothetical protein